MAGLERIGLASAMSGLGRLRPVKLDFKTVSPASMWPSVKAMAYFDDDNLSALPEAIKICSR